MVQSLNIVGGYQNHKFFIFLDNPNISLMIKDRKILQFHKMQNLFYWIMKAVYPLKYNQIIAILTFVTWVQVFLFSIFPINLQTTSENSLSKLDHRYKKLCMFQENQLVERGAAILLMTSQLLILQQ